MIAVTFSPDLRNSVFEAMRMVDFLDANLIVVHVGAQTTAKEEQLQKLLLGLDPADDKVQVFWRTGNPVAVILDIATTDQVDLILLSAIPRKKGYKFYIGSIARKITRRAPCSILMTVQATEDLRPCNHIVVNGLQSKKIRQTLVHAFKIAQNIGAKEITIVEETAPQKAQAHVVDDASMRKFFLGKEKLRRKEDLRVADILDEVSEVFKAGITVRTQSIFSTKGYSIGHYAEVVKADMLIMNAPDRNSIWNRTFDRDLEHVLAELPTDVLIIR